ncbi:uncharacterized protein LOC130777270 isoform X2 [Actinidia eriantha]|uniref:uncharacterized protein LOC130777270 isoform X2 n=1 Tax=Actinidia eriantha TaxID=165200 RepID=UPI00258E42D1|nr:uncharacterized protein LOC130777270 isoform X2 [Actinidia eriantha]
MASSSSSQSARPTPSSSSTPNNQTRQRSSGSTARMSGSSTTAPYPTSLSWDRQTIHFSVNAWKPRAWNLQALQVWFQSVIATKDFIYFIYCLTFVTSHLYLRLALIPILCLALEHAAKFLRRNFSLSSLYRKYLEEPCVWVESNTTSLGILSSQAAIGVGFVLILSLFSWQRNVIQTFMYLQLLKLMYQAPVTAGYHQSAWAKIGRTINPLVHCYAPFLNTPISAVQRWWFR